MYPGVPDNNFTGCLVNCVKDINTIWMQFVSAKDATPRSSTGVKTLHFTLMEPTIEYIMKCIFKDASQVCAGVSCDSHTSSSKPSL